MLTKKEINQAKIVLMDENAIAKGNAVYNDFHKLKKVGEWWEYYRRVKKFGMSNRIEVYKETMKKNNLKWSLISTYDFKEWIKICDGGINCLT